MKTIYEFLVDLGFRETVDITREYARTFVVRTTSTASCETNNKCPDFAVHVYPKQTLGGRWLPESVEVSLVADCGGLWFAMNPYSITPMHFIENHERIRRATEAAWNTFYASMKAEE